MTLYLHSHSCPGVVLFNSPDTEEVTARHGRYRLSIEAMKGRTSGNCNYTNPCLTMHQPWASLLVHGIKRIEGRSWPASIRGRLWIHAAGKVPENSTIQAMEEFYREIYAVDGITDVSFPEHYPVSRLLGCVEVVGCIRGEELASWEMVPEGVRLEGQTDYCWLCEQPQKLLIPFEMRGYQGIYNLERKIYEAAVRGLTPVQSPTPVRFPLPDPRDPFSLKPGSVSLRFPHSEARQVDKPKRLSEAISGARAAAEQFSNKGLKSATSTRSRSALEREKQPVINTDDGNYHPEVLGSLGKEKHGRNKHEGSSVHNQVPSTDVGHCPQPPSKIFAAAVRNLKPS